MSNANYRLIDFPAIEKDDIKGCHVCQWGQKCPKCAATSKCPYCLPFQKFLVNYNRINPDGYSESSKPSKINDNLHTENMHGFD
jgi:hypothetical protein